MNTLRLYAQSAVVVKYEQNKIDCKLHNGYVVTDNLDESKGRYYDFLKEEFPGYMIQDMSFTEIPPSTFICGTCYKKVT